MTFSHLKFIVLLTLVTGCVSQPKTELGENNQLQRTQQLESIDNWTLTGRLAIKDPNQANTLSFNWQRSNDAQLLLLYGSFGITYATLSESNDLATLELSDNKIYQSDNVEELLLNVLGYPLPIAHLDYWVRGLPYPDEQSDLTYDALGYLKTIHYKQWTISFKKYQHYETYNNLALPGKIKVTNGEVTLQFSLRKWQVGTTL